MGHRRARIGLGRRHATGAMEQRRKQRHQVDDRSHDRLDDERWVDSSALKYQQLCQKYKTLTEKFDDLTRQKTAVFELGWWALRTSDNGLALVRKGKIQLSNNRWHVLDHREGALQDWNATALQDDAAQIYPTLQDLALHQAAEALAESGPYPKVSRWCPRGRDEVLEVRTEIVDAEQRVVALLVHDVTREAHDETELRNAQDALLHRDRLQTIGEVASGVAHDLNNALNVMRLRLGLMRRDADEGRIQREHLDVLGRIVDDAAVRVARMHDLAGKRDEEVAIIDLGQTISEAVTLARANLEHSPTSDGPRFHVVTKTGGAPPVLANPTELRHLFVNLLLNARDAMPSGGTISIECRPESGCTTVAVADEGTGIPAENLQRIFESFFTTKGSRGTGLGLSMARGAMARIGGSIQARNRSPYGAEFLLRFPLQPGVEEPALPAPKPEPPSIHGNVRVLLVDDDADCLEVTQAVLEAEAVAVDVARSGQEAIALLLRGSYDLLLCDVGMPEMSGWEVAAQARIGHPALSIYMVTGWASEFASMDSHRHAVDGILGKPLDIGELREALGRVAATRERTGDGVPAQR
jgi:signal transduction histidine kinase/ActR/RegA family two-component response regulator